jgi:hypothetical protein
VDGFGWSWLAATVALGIHVADEATHDFLTWYNPRAAAIRRRLGGVPFPPVFTFRVWLGGLTVLLLVLLALTPLAHAGARWLRTVAWGFGIVQILNATNHLVGSAVARRAVPGVMSAPLVLLTAIWLLFAAARA